MRGRGGKSSRSRVWTASLIEPATTSPSLLRVTAAMSASNRTVTGATRSSAGFGDHRLLDRDQPVVECQALFLALRDGAGEGFVAHGRRHGGRMASRSPFQ